jgi:uncharacterized protein (TIGR02145 family)
MKMYNRYGRTLLLAAVMVIGTHTAHAQPQQYWIGDGGKGIRLAVLEPAGKGLSTDEQWMLDLVQRTITADFNKFSAITVIDRINVEKVLEQWKESMSGNYFDTTIVKIGNLTGANHILNGSISKTANAFMLELSVTDLTSGVRKASYAPSPILSMALENLSAIKTASVDLLRQLGVNLTSAGQSELTQTVNMVRIQAQTALSRGIAAQRQGTEVAALSYFFQAAAFDPSLFEASKRSSVMAANISSGNIGADVRNEILWRKNWVARLTEAEVTFYSIINTADPPYTLNYSTDIKKGNINYQKETADLSISIYISANRSWFHAMNRTLQAADAVLNGLNSTNRKNDWGLSNWPWNGVTDANPFASHKRYDIVVAFELVNEQGRAIGGQTIGLYPSLRIIRNNNNRFTVEYTEYALSTVNFNEVRADDISDNLTIRVASVNGVPPQNARFTITTMTEAELIKKEENARLVKLSTFITDSRDGQKYRVVKIGSKTWMAQNLNYKTEKFSSCYDNNESKCKQYGRLYDWITANTACPVGWHLPSREEWAGLGQAIGSDKEIDYQGYVNWKNAGRNLKARDGWNKNGNGTDEYGFSALPSGVKNLSNGNFFFAGGLGYWWTATEHMSGFAYNLYMKYDDNSVLENSNIKGNAFSVRCVKDD